jgi:hypothetical protein
MMLPSLNRKVFLKLAVLACFCGFSLAGTFQVRSDGKSPTASSARPTPTPRRRAVRRPPAPRKYSEFPHDAKAHQIECASCHKFPTPNWNTVRTSTDAFPDITDYPRHESCVGCHKQQFFKGNPPAICTICHTKPGPRNSARHPFPNPREIFDLSPKGKTAVSDFAVTFPHDKHIEIVSQNTEATTGFVNATFMRGTRRTAEESCSVCHKTMQPQGDSADEYVTKPPATLGEAFWLKKGTFKTSPIGHTTCFTCHNADSGILPTSETCSACHKLKLPDPPADFDAKLAAAIGIDEKVMMMAWRRRDSSGTFRHEFTSHADLECAMCHTVATINTADPATKKVAISSCAMCHATATTGDGGALNFEMEKRAADPKFQCTKCHISFGKLPVPKTHTDALSAATGK